MGLVSVGTVQRRALYGETDVKGDEWENKVGRKLEALRGPPRTGSVPGEKNSPRPLLPPGRSS